MSKHTFEFTASKCPTFNCSPDMPSDLYEVLKGIVKFYYKDEPINILDVEEDASKLALIDLHLSVRALNVLRAWDIKTMADLIRFTPEELCKLRNISRTNTLLEIIQCVKKYGFELGMLPHKVCDNKM